MRLRQGGQDGSARRKADDSFSKRGGWRDVTRDVLLIDSPSRAKSPHSVEKHDDPRESDGGRGNPTLSQGIHPSKAKDDNGRHKSRREEAHLPQSRRFERGSDSGNSQIVNQRGILGKEAGGVQLADLTRTQSLSHEADNLVERRLRQAYGFGISDKEVRYIARMQAKIANSKVSALQNLCFVVITGKAVFFLK